MLILLSAAPERLLSTICSRCQLIRFLQLAQVDLQRVLQRCEAQEADPRSCWPWPLDPGALLEHRRQRAALPDAIRGQLERLPEDPMQALALARDLCEALDGEQQLWLINWWQQHLWRSGADAVQIRRLDSLRRQLLSFVQPRLAWEVALLDMNHNAA